MRPPLDCFCSLTANDFETQRTTCTPRKASEAGQGEGRCQCGMGWPEALHQLCVAAGRASPDPIPSSWPSPGAEHPCPLFLATTLLLGAKSLFYTP